MSFIGPNTASRAINEFAAMERSGKSTPVPRLTVRELEVLKLMAGGRTNEQISRHLPISEIVAQNHVRIVLEKIRLYARM